MRGFVLMFSLSGILAMFFVAMLLAKQFRIGQRIERHLRPILVMANPHEYPKPRRRR